MPSKDDEIVELVNERDEVIGEVLKVKANQDPALWHREIAILLFNKDNKILLQQRSHTKVVNPGKWAISCAGHVTKGMTIEAAAHMELQEELGIDVKLIFIEKVLDKEPNETHFTNWFIGKYTEGEIVLEEDEVAQVAWVNQTELQNLIESGASHTKELVKYPQRFWEGEFDGLVQQLH